MSAEAPAPSKKTPRRVEPRTLKGFLDLLPAQAMHRQVVLDRIRPVIERFGFSPIETPIMEYLDTLIGAGGEETNKELFRLETPEEERAALRFDLTVPFARLLAQYPEEMKTPYRRYAIGPVFRADKPGPGRYRQFTQFDFDAAGTSDVAADAEICAILCETMVELGIADARLDINSRRLVDALLVECGISEPERQKHVLRIVDKLGKVGIQAVRQELGPGRIDDSGDKIRGAGLDDATIARIEGFLALGGATRRGVLDAVDAFLSPGKAKDESLAEMRDLADHLDALGVTEAQARFDPSLARGLDYYTGPVFEMKVLSAPQFGTVAAGGRYDGLVERFSPNATAATGASFGVDRLLAVLEFLSKAPLPQTTTKVLLVTFRGVPKSEYLRLATELRRAGIATEIFLGKKKAGVTDQLSHANARGIPVAVIAGGDELARGEVAVKDLRAGADAREGIEDREAYLAAGKAGQVTIARGELLATIRGLLAK